MTKDDIIRMAREAGFLVDGDSWIHAGAVLVDGRKSIDKPLKVFANLVAAAEREACETAVEDIARKYQKVHEASLENIADE